MSFDMDSVSPISRASVEPRYRFVISIDYGTTYTGAAWFLTTGETPTLDKIQAVQNWQSDIKPKVPSQFTYTRCKGPNWGFGIGPEALVIRWTKLELPPLSRVDALRNLRDTLVNAESLRINRATNMMENEVPRHLIKSSEQIMADYLTKVATYVRKDIEKTKDPQTLGEYPIDLIITHPAVWPDQAKNITFRAANKAFGDVFSEMADNPGHVRLTTEPEACAQYTMRNAQNEGIARLRKGDCFVVVDAGGGTVVRGANCGATCIDTYFTEHFLRNRLSEVHYNEIMGKGHIQGRDRVWKGGHREILERFDGPIKQKFEGQTNGRVPSDQVLELPEAFGYLNDPSNNIRDGQLMITCDDLEEMFKKSVEGTIKLIEGQISQIDRQNLTAAAIFLSGGFSESPYLRKKIRTLAEEKRCMFYSDGDRWTAVAKGAVLMGLGAGCDVPPAQLQCPYNIGVVVSARFTQFDHEDRQMYQDTLDGNYRARNHIKWVVKQGDLVSSGEGIVERVHVRRKFTQNGNKSGRVTVVLSTGELHQNHPDVFEVDKIASKEYQVVNLDYNLSNMPYGVSQRVKPQSKLPVDSTNADPYDEEEMHVELRINQQEGGRVALLYGATEEAPGFRLASRDLFSKEAILNMRNGCL
ncbi:Chaperone protein DnaK [Colletotrichum sojae]|uniref:Chaperone protein DnaK n=1 Tax=Colletotrichum sojae TaxID=2175907 RepID=A0A8H6IUJ2_9PEZI|nr:Chaperone protein DnaK [Colletotrichum sojae]